jgi:hypothetical protein
MTAAPQEPDAWLLRLTFALMVAAAGALVALTYEMTANSGDPTEVKLWIAGWTGAGGGSLAVAMSGWIGRSGPGGWSRALAAAWLCSVFGGFVGGTMLAPGIGSVIGAVIGALFFVWPPMLFVWALGFFVVQGAAVSCRTWLGRRSEL